MSDRPRLRDEGTSLEQRLLASSDNDHADKGAKKRALAALGLGGTAAIAIKSALAPKAIAHASLWKLTAVKIVTAVLVAGAAGAIAYHAIARPEVAPVPVPPSVVTARPAPHPSTMPIEAPTASAALTAAAPIASTRHAPKPTAIETPTAAPEVDWIDRAQTALARHPARALQIVDDYRAQVSPRTFDEEADVIAIEASAKSGDLARARQEASAFEAAYPRSAYRAKVEAVVPPEN